jgi:hypothetical protein
LTAAKDGQRSQVSLGTIGEINPYVNGMDSILYLLLNGDEGLGARDKGNVTQTDKT